MNHIKKISLVITLLIISLYTLSIYSQEVQYNKNVSVVFDDSGSMAFDVRWAHANYALQTLISVLDEGDILNIHYMNASTKDLNIVIENGSNVEAILETVRDNSVPDLLGDGETPIESIEVGLDYLETDNSLLKANTKYEHWLILITDGNEMKDISGEGYVNYVEDNSFDSGFKWTGILDRKIASILSSASIDYNTVILKIGDTSQDMLLTSSMIGSPLIYKSASVSDEVLEDKEIIESMNDIASLISGRLPIEILEVSDNSIKINSPVPFNNFDLLLQNSNSKVVSVTNDSLGTLNVDVTYKDLLSPESTTIGSRQLASDTNLYGSAIRLVSSDEEALPEGEYMITFDQNVENAKVTSYCYPYIQFVYNYYVNGLEVDKVYQEDMVSLEFIPVRGGTDEVLTNLPKEIKFSLDLKSGDQFLTFKEGSLKTNEFLIKDDTLEGSLTAEIPDIWLWALDVSEAIDVAPKEEKAPDRIFELQISSTDTSVRYQDYDTRPEVILTPYLNGEVLTKDEMSNAELNIARITIGDSKMSSIDYELNKLDNYFTFKPIYDGFRPSMPAEVYTVEFRFAANATEGVNEYAFGEITYEIQDASFFVRYFVYIISTIIAVIIAIYLIGLTLKARFKENKYGLIKLDYDSIIDLDEPIATESFNIKVDKFNRLFIPFKRELGSSAGFSFKAGSKSDHVYLEKKSQKEGMVIGSFALKGESVGLRDLRLNVDQKLEIVVDDKLTVYKYVDKK